VIKLQSQLTAAVTSAKQNRLLGSFLAAKRRGAETEGACDSELAICRTKEQRRAIYWIVLGDPKWNFKAATRPPAVAQAVSSWSESDGRSK
jgi:hypothetical protein